MWLALLVASVGLVGSVQAADAPPSCLNGQKCPEDKPCCSQFGQCGTGIFCLGACDPLLSYNISSCAPLPLCQSKTYTFKDLDETIKQDKYFGDPSKHGWTYSGEVLQHQDQVLLTMAKNSYGTVMSSTRGIWYGKVSAEIKSSHGPGVVGAFIFMSGIKDEIDYEFVGNELDLVQTNFYAQGFLDYTHSVKLGLSNTEQNWHTYEIDWQENEITWSVDGQVGRTLKKADTWNEISKQFMFPSTPSIIQFSLWPAGQASNAKGTIEWAGGEINWDDPDFKDPGYLHVAIKSIKVECAKPLTSAKISGQKAYGYRSSDNPTEIEITDKDTELGSFEAVGFDMNKGKDASSTQSQAPITDIGKGMNENRSPVTASNNTTMVTGSSNSTTKQKTSATASSKAPSGSGEASSDSLSGFKQGTTSKDVTSPASALTLSVSLLLAMSIIFLSFLAV